MSHGLGDEVVSQLASLPGPCCHRGDCRGAPSGRRAAAQHRPLCVFPHHATALHLACICLTCKTSGTQIFSATPSINAWHWNPALACLLGVTRFASTWVLRRLIATYVHTGSCSGPLVADSVLRPQRADYPCHGFDMTGSPFSYSSSTG